MKETAEIFDALELIINKINLALEDGKFDVSDVTILISLLGDYKVFVEAVKCKDIAQEYKDISEQDAAELAIRSYKFIKSIVEMAKLAGDMKKPTAV